jgi:hypothetical protein
LDPVFENATILSDYAKFEAISSKAVQFELELLMGSEEKGEESYLDSFCLASAEYYLSQEGTARSQGLFHLYDICVDYLRSSPKGMANLLGWLCVHAVAKPIDYQALTVLISAIDACSGDYRYRKVLEDHAFEQSTKSFGKLYLIKKLKPRLFLTHVEHYINSRVTIQEDEWRELAKMLAAEDIGHRARMLKNFIQVHKDTGSLYMRSAVICLTESAKNLEVTDVTS